MASIGQSLREEREARNISVEEIAVATKIVSRHLEALEADRLDMMPGGFFVKGIIRAYASAIGLDPDEVLGRYKAAGLIGRTEAGRDVAPRHAPEHVPQTSPIPPPPAELVLPSEKAPAPAAALAPEPAEPVTPQLIFEEAPKPRLSPEARKKILSWIWRAAAALAFVTAIVLLWPSKRPPPAAPAPGTVVTQQALPPRSEERSVWKEFRSRWSPYH